MVNKAMAEIFLIITGVLILIAGFILPEGSDATPASKEKLEKDVNDAVRRSVEDSSAVIKSRISDEVDSAIENTDDKLDRITNEKITAISEYTATVLDDIKKNHDEVMFMYEMLNDKHKKIKSTVAAAPLPDTALKPVSKAASNQVSNSVTNSVSKPSAVKKKKSINLSGFSYAEVFGKNDKDNFKSMDAAVLPSKDKHIIGGIVLDSENNGNSALAKKDISEKDKADINTIIMEMHKNGSSDVSIAKKLEMGVGEVRLIIDIKENKQGRVSDET